jgi:hypothetical protein
MIKGDDIPLDPFLKGIIKGEFEGVSPSCLRSVPSFGCKNIISVLVRFLKF